MITPYKAKKDIRPYLVSALDIETASNGDVLAVGFAWTNGDDRRHYKAFEGWKEWLEFFTSLYEVADKETRERLRYIYAHNGGNFDWLSLIEWALKTGNIERMKFIPSGGIGIGVDIRIKRVTIKLRDSVRLMPGRLGDLAQSFKTNAQKDDVPDHYKSKMEDFKRDHPAKFWEYLRNDVLSLQDVVKAFWTLIYNKVGSIERLPMTLPALAMRLWRMTLKDDVYVSTYKPLKELERRAYTGGRTECYNAIPGIYTRVYDANSLYPTVMESMLFPAGYHGGWVTEYHGDHGIYEIEYYQTNRAVKPVLRDEATQDFLYEGSGVYTQPEVEMFLKIGGTFNLKKGYVYEEMIPLFRDFIRDWYGTRLRAQIAGDTGLAYVCKILMNSLYGKFGQKEVGEVIYFWDDDKLEEETEKLTNGHPDAKEFLLMGDYVICKEDRHSETTFVGIAAYITAHARLNLYEQMLKVHELGGMLVATDTDSVHVVGIELPTGKELGEWKLEKAGRAAYLGKKLYAFENGEVKAKGIGRDARDKLDYETFKRLAETGNSLVTEFTVFPSIKEVLSGKRKACEPFTRKRTIRATAPLANIPPHATIEGD